MTNKLHTFFALPGKLKLLFLEALFLQYTIWMILQIVPFKRLPRLFVNPRKPVENPGRQTLEQIKLATGYASVLSFWKNKCLVQSLAARCMLRRRKIASSLFLGVDMDSGKQMYAHAWLKSGDFELVEKGGHYKELFCF